MILKKNKLKILLAFGAFFLVLASLLYVIFVPRPVKVEVARVTRGTFQETIRADGILRSKERYTVPAFGDGDIKRVSLRVGDPIKKGEKITELLWSVKYLPVRSPINGVISKVYRESAGPIRRGDPIVEIVDPSRLEVMAELLTTDAVRLRPGASAQIENWTGGRPIRARVIRISKAGFTKPSALGVEEERTEVISDLDHPRHEIFENMGDTFHIDVTFKVSESKNVLKVPVGSLFRDGPDWAVYLAENGRASKKKVEVDAIGPQEASIKTGLEDGQLVLLYPGDLVKDGSRISVERSSQ